MSASTMKTTRFLLVSFGVLLGTWALASLVGGLYKSQWNLVEFTRQFMIASGIIQPIHTLVDFYTHIKGIEYIICILFFVAFPIFFRFVDKREREVRLNTKARKP